MSAARICWSASCGLGIERRDQIRQFFDRVPTAQELVAGFGERALGALADLPHVRGVIGV